MRPKSCRVALFTAVLLLAAFARFAALDRLPPGWRDDELIEVNMDSRIAAGWHPLYIEEAEGHEPLYHYIHAATIELFGSGRLSYRWLGAASGLLAVALTMAVGKQLFGWRAAVFAGAAMAVSFWPLMYSRLGLRHIGTLPALLLAISNLRFKTSNSTSQSLILNLKSEILNPKSIACGAAMAAGLYIYFAGRVVPFIFLAFAIYLALFHRDIFKRQWIGLLVAGIVTLLLFAPLGWYLAHRPLEARLEIVGKPLLELRKGNLAPMIETTLGTLGMFTFRGDPEWLYNVSGRPVFDWLTGAFFYLGVALALWRWKRIEYSLLIIWLAVGIAPGLVSLPAGSLGHTIAALPAVYLLLGLGLAESTAWLSRRAFPNPQSPISTRHKAFIGVMAIAVLSFHGVLSAQAYVVSWSQYSYTRFLYHADMADLARALAVHPDMQNVAVATVAEELQLDARGLALDLPGARVNLRLFDPRYALVVPAGPLAYIALTTFPPPNPSFAAILQGYPLVLEGPPVADGPAYRIYRAGQVSPEQAGCNPISFGGGRLMLASCQGTLITVLPGQSVSVSTTWRVGSTGGLPPALKLFFHLVSPGGELVVAGDRLDLLPSSLHPGDVFVQLAEIALPASLPPGDYDLQVGVYEADTNQRWQVAAPGNAVRLAIVRVSGR